MQKNRRVCGHAAHAPCEDGCALSLENLPLSVWGLKLLSPLSLSAEVHAGLLEPWPSETPGGVMTCRSYQSTEIASNVQGITSYPAATTSVVEYLHEGAKAQAPGSGQMVLPCAVQEQGETASLVLL